MQEFATHKAPVLGRALNQLTCLTRKHRIAVRIMKLTAILLLGACLQLSARGISQTISLSVKDASLRDVFKSIEKQTDYAFFFDEGLLSKAKKVTIKVSNFSLSQVLDLCFKGQPFTYTISGKTITLVRKKDVADADNQPEIQSAKPPIDIKGRVVNANGEPISDATISVKGSPQRTITNANGEFLIKGVDKDAIVIISHVQYETTAITLKGNGIVNATLQLRINSLDELQVIAYGTTTKRFNTGNVSTVKSEDIQKQPVNNPLLALQGRVPGMEITQYNGLPGSGVKVQIRGQNSIQNGVLPLYIIDGVPYLNENLPNLGSSILGISGNVFGRGGNPLSLLNSADIESIDVLKDADATAIYGSRGANGVVLITTKKGKAGKLKIDANIQTGFGKVAKKIKLLNTQQYLEMRREAFKNDNVNTIPSTAYDLTLWDTTRYTNWQKELIGGTAQYNQAQLSLSGGNNNTSFLLSGTFHRETTVFPGNLSDRQGSLHLNLNSSSLNQKFRLSISANYNVNDNRLVKTDFTNFALTIAPNGPSLYNDNGTINWAPDASGRGTWTNPVAAYAYSKFRSNSNNLIANTVLRYEIINGLEIKTSLGYNFLNSNELTTDPAIGKDPSLWQLYGNQLRTSSFANGRATSWIIEPQISYLKNIFGGQLNLLIGGTIQKNKGIAQQISASGFSSDLLMEDPSFAAATIIGGLSYSEYKYSAIFGRLSYNWKEKYLVNLTTRRDGTSRFGPANRFHNFGAAGIGWIFTKEKLIENNLKFISFGKVRASYGTTGSDAVGDYSFFDLYSSTGATSTYQGAVGLQLTRLFTPDLAWESTKKTEAGLELGFLSNRVILTASRYENRSSNQLVGYNLPYLVGFITIKKNLEALIKNYGWEFTLNTVNINSKSFRWTTSFNTFWNRNKLISADSGIDAFYKQFIGRPLNSAYLYKYAGVDPATGVYQFVDSKGNVVSTPNAATDITVLYDRNPKFSGGVLNSFEFKNFQIDIFFQYVKQKGLNYLFNFLPGRFSDITWGNQPVTVMDRWRKVDDVTNIQRFSQNSSVFTQYNLATQSDLLLEDISFIKLKNISVSWQVPNVWTQKNHLHSCKLYIQGQNLLTFTNYKGFDPETKNVTSLPPLRVITGGIQIVL